MSGIQKKLVGSKDKSYVFTSKHSEHTKIMYGPKYIYALDVRDHTNHTESPKLWKQDLWVQITAWAGCKKKKKTKPS